MNISSCSSWSKKEAAMNWYLDVLKKYAVFSGRARRKEYWYFYLFNTIIEVALMLVDYMIGWYSIEGGIGVLSAIYALGIMIPGIAVSIRRLHDTGRSSWWLLIGLIPFIGAIVLLVFMVQDSKSGENEYGPNPKEVMA